MAVSLEGSSSEQSGPGRAALRGAEHPVERLLPELRGRGLHTGFQPEPCLQAADGNSAVQSTAVQCGSAPSEESHGES